MKIFIEDLEFEAIIGLLDFERETPQRVIVNLEIDYQEILEGESSYYLDYAKIVELTKSFILEERFLLLEEAVDSLIALLGSKFSSINYIKCKISKPDIFDECKVSVENERRF